MTQTHHWNDVGGHVWEAHATGMERADQQLSVFICVLVLGHVVGLYHLLLQHVHQLKTNNTTPLFTAFSVVPLVQKRIGAYSRYKMYTTAQQKYTSSI